MSEDDPSEYEVGYKKTPKHTQFKKGQSGNPMGRRSKKANHMESRQEINRRILFETVFTANGRSMTRYELLRRTALNAAASKGNVKALEAVFDETAFEAADPVDYREELRRKLADLGKKMKAAGYVGAEPEQEKDDEDNS